jgi:CHAT domain-containing protein
MTDGHIDMADMEGLAGIPEESSAELPPDLSESRDHLMQCPHCSNLLAAYRQLRHTPPSVLEQNPSGCPSDEQWFAFAFGDASADQATGILEHVRCCSACSEKMRALLDVKNKSDDAEQDLGHLRSSTSAWQNRVARQMSLEMTGAGSGTTNTKQESWIRRWRAALILVPAVCSLLVAGAIIITRIYLRSTDRALLARAYDERRLTELYFPGGQPVAVFSPTLGPSEPEDVLPLLELRERAQQHLAKNPNDAYWQQMLGRIALTEGNGEKALKKLELASALNPALPGIKFDLAAAHFEIGEAKQKPSEFVMAADLFGQVVDDAATVNLKAAAYYNRALCWGRLAVYHQAASDFQSALKFETDAAWRAKIQASLDELKIKERNGEGRGSLDLDTSPDGFLRAMRNDPHRVEPNYEIYLDHASREWLIQHNARSEQALHQLGTVGLTHHDPWLRDLLNGNGNDKSRHAMASLAGGLQANVVGNADRALSSFATAADLFHQSRNRAGLLRARVEMLYTFQRMGRSDECVKLASDLSPQLRWRDYAWLYSYELLEVSICRNARGDSSEHLSDILQCLELSRAARLPVQVLRERGMLVETLDSVGQTEEAMRETASALKECADGVPCSPMRAYQFQQTLLVIMQEKRLRWAAADVAEAAAHTSESLSNVQIRAYAYEALGTAETEARHIQKARDAFAKASTILNLLPDGNAAALYRADWEADRSILLEQQGKLPLALLNMRRVASQISATDNFDIRQRYYTRMAGLLLDAGRPADALKASLFAVTDAEHALGSARTETERLSWEKSYGRGYRLLVECLAAMGKPRESLQAWEWYHSAPYRSPTPSLDPARPAFAAVQLPASSDARADGLILVMAQLEDAVVVWSLSGSAEKPVRMMVGSSSPQHVSEIAQTFTELCSDRDSSESDIEVLGSQLYRYLLLPFDDLVQHESRLALEVDAHLQRLPFAALIRPDHRYLNDTHSLVFLPAWWTLRPSAPDTIPEKASALLVEGAPGIPNSGTESASTIPAEYFVSREVATHFSRYVILQQTNVDQVLRHIPEADVFHYNGHSLTVAEETGLLLQSPNEIFTASKLRGVHLQRCKLAVLATCSSASGSDQGIEDTSNLTHALLIAGAANVVATLWDVDARASRLMILEMYDSLARSTPVATAIHTAQLKMRSDPATRHPYFWSSVQVFTQ